MVFYIHLWVNLFNVHCWILTWRPLWHLSVQQWKSDTGNKNNGKCTWYPKWTGCRCSWWKCSGDYMGGMLEGNVIHMHCVGGRLEVWPWEFAWAFDILYNQRDFNLDKSKKRSFTEDSYLGPCVGSCVCSSAIIDPPLLYPSVHFG